MELFQWKPVLVVQDEDNILNISNKRKAEPAAFLQVKKMSKEELKLPKNHL
jgi:hypothetical protein